MAGFELADLDDADAAPFEDLDGEVSGMLSGEDLMLAATPSLRGARPHSSSGRTRGHGASWAPSPTPEAVWWHTTGSMPNAQLERLAQLKAQGILTDEEFAAQKAKLLGM